jgi:hypothetical protein
MKTSNEMKNKIKSISIAGWTNQFHQGKRPTHAGSVAIEFEDGSSLRLPYSFWADASPEGRRPNITGTIDLYKLGQQVEMSSNFHDEEEFTNPHLLKQTQPAAVTDSKKVVKPKTRKIA